MSVTRLVTTPDSGSTPNASGAFTPTAGTLLVAVIVGSASTPDADDVPTASANGITFVRAASVVQATNHNAIYVANQLVPASPASMTVTWTPTDVATSTVIDVYEVTGMTRTGALAIKQTDTGTGALGTTPETVFAAACQTGNVTIVSAENVSAPAGVTEPSGWTEANDTNCTTPTVGLEVAYRLSGFTGTTITWGSTSATAWSACAVELDTSALPDGPDRTTLLGQISTEPFGTGDFTTSAFTPPSNSLLVVCVSTMRVTDATDLTSSIGVSGGGWTFTPRVGIGSSTSVFSCSQRIFTAPVGTGASMTLTVTTGGANMQFYAVSVVAYENYDTGTPTGATGTLLVESSGAPDGAQSFTLSGAPATDSEVIAAITLDKDAAGTTPGADFTEIHDLQLGGTGGEQSQIRVGSTSTTVAWVDTNTGGAITKFVAAAVEIKNAPSGPEEIAPNRRVLVLSQALHGSHSW